MHSIMDFVKSFIRNHKAFLWYGIISVFVTVIDVVICRLCEQFTSPVIANTIGVVTGFILQYFLTARHVYNTKSIKSFIIFLGTFLLNLLMANGVIYFCRTIVFHNSTGNAAFLISKGISIVLPFFITYFIRKKIMPSNKGEEQ